MAWWTTQLVFRDDTLIAEGIDPVPLGELDVMENGEQPAGNTEHYSRVIVSGYALYGKLRGYYALGVSHWQLDRAGGRVYMSRASQHHTESVSSLSSIQRSVVKEFLIDMSPEAWAASNRSFRQKLEA